MSGETVAAKIGLPPEQVFKTLAARGPERNLPNCNFRKPGVELQGARKPDRGGEDRDGSHGRSASLDRLHWWRSAARACKKDYAVYIEELAEICDVISVSAGIRGAADLASPC